MSQGVNEKLQRWGFDTEIDPLNEQNRVPSFLALEALETLERSMKSYSLPFSILQHFFQRRRRGDVICGRGHSIGPCPFGELLRMRNPTQWPRMRREIASRWHLATQKSITGFLQCVRSRATGLVFLSCTYRHFLRNEEWQSTEISAFCILKTSEICSFCIFLENHAFRVNWVSI